MPRELYTLESFAFSFLTSTYLKITLGLHSVLLQSINPQSSYLIQETKGLKLSNRKWRKIWKILDAE